MLFVQWNLFMGIMMTTSTSDSSELPGNVEIEMSHCNSYQQI